MKKLVKTLVLALVLSSCMIHKKNTSPRAQYKRIDAQVAKISEKDKVKKDAEDLGFWTAFFTVTMTTFVWTNLAKL